jgi:hypothetical protein
LEIAGSEEFIRYERGNYTSVLSLHNNNDDESFKAMNFMADNKGVIDTVLDIMMTFSEIYSYTKKPG